jgi:sodium-dependent dicarboxylate transporter 2/3/5
MEPKKKTNPSKLRQQLGFWVGTIAFILLLLLPVPEGLSPEGMRVAAVALLMACFWISECVPIPATALFPMFLFPLLKVLPTAAVTAAYGDEIVFLFMGGFMIGVTMQKWNLHRRIALNIINGVGSSERQLVLGFMLGTALLSMWISNSATVMMMAPVAIAVTQEVRKIEGLSRASEHFGTALMLSVAYSASIGGLSTLVGTPPNAIFVGLAKTLYGVDIDFVDWLKVGLPISCLLFIFCWLQLTRFQFPLSNTRDTEGRVDRHIQQELNMMGSISSAEFRVALIFSLVATLWIVRGLLKPAILALVSDPSIAMAGAFALFLLPVSTGKKERLLDWETATSIPWDIILLMGGGFALASGFQETGLTKWLAEELEILSGISFVLIVTVVVTVVVFLTEMTSNAATATLFIPVMGALAISLGQSPLALMVPTALACSMAFMLPVATPPNAIVFGTREITIDQMMRVGLLLNLVSILILIWAGVTLAPQLY